MIQSNKCVMVLATQLTCSACVKRLLKRHCWWYVSSYSHEFLSQRSSTIWWEIFSVNCSRYLCLVFFVCLTAWLNSSSLEFTHAALFSYLEGKIVDEAPIVYLREMNSLYKEYTEQSASDRTTEGSLSLPMRTIMDVIDFPCCVHHGIWAWVKTL